MKDSNHHELLELVESVIVTPPLQELACSNEVPAARFQARIEFFQYALQHAKTSSLQTGLQQTLKKNFLWALLNHNQGEKWDKFK